MHDPAAGLLKQVEIACGREKKQKLDAKTAKARLDAVVEVNRVLHSKIIEKKQAASEAMQEIVKLEEIMSRWDMEIKAREASITELVHAKELEQNREQSINLDLRRRIMEQEEKVAELTSLCNQLRIDGTKNKAAIRNLVCEVKGKEKKAKELTRALEIMRSVPNDELCEDEVPDERLSEYSERTAGSPRSLSRKGEFKKPTTIEGWRNLPGLDVQLLLGESLNDTRPVTPASTRSAYGK